MTHQEKFEALVRKYQLECEKEDEEQTPEEEQLSQEFYWSISPTLLEIQKEDEYFVIAQLKECFEKLNIPAMDILVDFVREGSAPSKQHGAILEILLKLCFKVLENFEQVIENDPFHFIKQVYEIIWHSGLDDYQKSLYPLYLDLTYELLSDKYHTHENEDNEDRYRNSVIYWILMNSYQFKKSDKDFKLIFNMLKKNPHNYPSDFRYWEEHYREINKAKK